MTRAAATRYFTLAMAGHVDHGKTSLIKVLTGINPDRLKEEQERQMTTDLGFAHLALGPAEDLELELILGFIDVPGHGKFLKNMLAGVGGVDIALLVVAADEGPMPQTLQHIKILSLLGVKSCLVALTKIDLADAGQIAAAGQAVADMLDQFGIELISISQVNAVSGSGVEALKEELKKTFGRRPPAAVSQAVYLPVDRVFSKVGHGTVITGTLVEGHLTVGQQLTVEPGALSARVRGLETFGRKVDKVSAGQRVAANLAVKENVGLARGHSLVDGDRQSATSLIVELIDSGGLEFFGETTEAQSALKKGSAQGAELKGGQGHQISPQAIKLYHGTAELKGSLRWLEPVEACADHGQGRPRYLAQIHLSEPVVARPGDRYVVRYGDDGIAGGSIVFCDRPRWLTRKLLVENAAVLLGEEAEPLLSFVLANSPRKALKEEELLWALPLTTLRRLVAQKPDYLCEVAGHFMDLSVKTHIENEILSALAGAAAEAGAGVPASITVEVLKSAFNNLSRAVFQALLKELEEKALLEREDDKLFVAGSRAKQAAKVQAAEDPVETKLLELLADHPCLEIAELAKQANLDGKKLQGYLDTLGRKGKTEIINYEFVATRQKVTEAHQLLQKLWQAKRDISPADFRDGLATSRKYALALLAYFDDHQITRRLNTGRVLLKAPPAVSH